MEVKNNILKSSGVAFLWMCYLLLFCAKEIKAQVNYVINPSLEIYDTCPWEADQIKFAVHWSSIDTSGIGSGVPEYCNLCAGSNAITGVPLTSYYYHYPRTGNGMAQVVMFTDSSLLSNIYQRDYLEGRLYKPLIAGKSYCVTFFVTLEQRGAKYGINYIGAYLDNGEIDTAIHTSGLPQTQYTPQIVETGIISDTLNWVKVEGSFIANGTEKFITIGNFYDISHTSYIVTNQNAGGGSYYLVDDISVIKSDHIAFAGNDTSIYKGDSILLGEIALPYTWYKDSSGLRLIDSTSGGIWVKPDTTTTYVVKQTLCGVMTWDTIVVSVMPVNVVNVQNGVSDFRMYPNPNNGSFNIKTPRFDSRYVTIEVLNMMGQLVYSETVTVKNNSLDKQVNLKVPPGVYMLRVMGDSGSSTIQRVAVQ